MLGNFNVSSLHHSFCPRLGTWGHLMLHRFHCLFCHGYEERDVASVGVLAIGNLAHPASALRVARTAKRFSKMVTFYTNGIPGDELAAALASVDVAVDSRIIKRLIKGSVNSEVVLELGSENEQKMEGWLVHHPYTTQASPFAEQLALDMTANGDIKVGEIFGNTSVPGVFAAGDCATPIKMFAHSSVMGTFAAAGAIVDLQAEA
jgi:thioredoxin reductase